MSLPTPLCAKGYCRAFNTTVPDAAEASNAGTVAAAVVGGVGAVILCVSAVLAYLGRCSRCGRCCPQPLNKRASRLMKKSSSSSSSGAIALVLPEALTVATVNPTHVLLQSPPGVSLHAGS